VTLSYAFLNTPNQTVSQSQPSVVCSTIRTWCGIMYDGGKCGLTCYNYYLL